MMENAKETLSHILLSKKDKCIQNRMLQRGTEDTAMDQNSLSDKNDLRLDRSFNKCCFCTKVFVNSKFLIQHVLRRHSENLVVMYRKLYDFNAADHLSHNDVVNIITSEFSGLKKDLEFIKSSLPVYQSCSNCYSNLPAKETDSLQVKESLDGVAGKVDVLTAELTALRVANENITKDIEDLRKQWNESDVKSLCSGSDMKGTLLYQTLKSDLLLNIQGLVADNNEKLKLAINQLSLNCKADVERLENTIAMNLEKIDASTLVQETLKSLEKEIEFFFSCHKAKKFKTHTSELNLSKISAPKVKPSLKQEVVNLKNNEKSFLVEKSNDLNSRTSSKKSPFSEHKIKKLAAQASELILTEKTYEEAKEVEPNSGQEVVSISSELENKLNSMNIPPYTNRLSNTDYTAKMKLVESEREALTKKYQSFSDVYRCLNSALDNVVSQKLKAGKKSRKIRFSLMPKTSCNKLTNKAESGDANLMERLSDLQVPKVSSKKPKDIFEGGDTKLVERPSHLHTSKASCKKLINKFEGGDAKLVERLSDLQDGSSVEDISVKKSDFRNITPINISDKQLRNHNLIKSDSAASLKLISSSNKKRNLPSFPQLSESKELSPYDSLESDY